MLWERVWTSETGNDEIGLYLWGEEGKRKREWSGEEGKKWGKKKESMKWKEEERRKKVWSGKKRKKKEWRNQKSSRTEESSIYGQPAIVNLTTGPLGYSIFRIRWKFYLSPNIQVEMEANSMSDGTWPSGHGGYLERLLWVSRAESDRGSLTWQLM